MEITLNEVEFLSAAYTGLLISWASRKAGLRDMPMKGGVDSLYLNQIGALGEMVVAKCLDLYYGGAAFTFAKPDLSFMVEVRTIGNQGLGLKVRPRDAPEKRIVGVLVPDDLETRKFVVAGWIPASDAKQERWLCDPGSRGRPVYYVPLSELRSIEELRREIARERGG